MIFKQPAMKVNYFNHDFSTSSVWSDCHDRQLGTNVIIDHTQFYHADSRTPIRDAAEWQQF